MMEIIGIKWSHHINASGVQMSIYPVRIKEWYVEGKPFGAEMPMLKSMLRCLPCIQCGKKIRWDRGYVMHSITFGGPDGRWCSKKCLGF
jgi:hypothetical protein